jgi:ribosomal protein S18 acetylase RimI-like enzyme
VSNQLIQAVRLDKANFKDVGVILSRAFQDDPMFTYIFSDPLRRAMITPKVFHSLIKYSSSNGGEVYTTPEAPNGGAIWLSPGNTHTKPLGMVRAGMIGLFLSLNFGERKRFFQVINYMEKTHDELVPRPNWYLQVLGVEPTLQGRGIGSNLIQPVLAKADSAKHPCYLETMTPKNVPLYQKHGFEIIKEGNIPGTDVYVWHMNREPH